MTTFKQVQYLNGDRADIIVNDGNSAVIKGDILTLLPGLIDPHVHFRTPGMEYKENWVTAALAAISGGYTTVFDMPNTIPPTITKLELQNKIKLIDEQLIEAKIPLRYKLFFGADKNHFDEITKIKSEIIGIKVFMGCSTGNLVIDDDESLEKIFEIAAKLNLLIAVHAEDETILQHDKKNYRGKLSYSSHSVIRSPGAAITAVEKAISLTRKFGTKLYILHVSTIQEIDAIRQAKLENLPVFAETTPHHLFLDKECYADLEGRAVVNPPLRKPDDCKALFAAINEGVIDTIGSDHAPHTTDEKSKPYGECPSGMPGIETTLPLLLTAYKNGFLSLDKVVSLTCNNPREIFFVDKNDDWVLVNLDKARKVDETKLATKCKWSSFHDRELYGWPEYVFLQDQLYSF